MPLLFSIKMEADTFLILQQRVPHLLSNWVVKEAYFIVLGVLYREKVSFSWGIIEATNIQSILAC